MTALITAATTKITEIVDAVGTLGVACIGIGATIAVVTLIVYMIKKH